MEIVAEMPDTRVEGFLAAGHAATITGWGVFEAFVERHRLPVVVAGFEPLDVLAGLVRLVELIHDETPQVENMYPRCVTREGNAVAQEQLWQVFRPLGGRWRGIAHVPNGNLRLRDEYAHVDARRRFHIDLATTLDVRTTYPRAALHLRRHHGGPDVADRLSTVRQGMPPRHAGRRLHGEQRGHLPDLAPVRRPSRVDPGGRGESVKLQLPIGERISLKHGAGGRAMRALIEQVFLDGVDAPLQGIGLAAMDDGAAIPVGERWLVLTTDSHVIHPLFFPGETLAGSPWRGR